MQDRINLDDPSYDQSQNRVVVQDNKAKSVWVVLGIIAAIVIAVAGMLNGSGSSSGSSVRLNGTYMAVTDVSLNAIVFSDDGTFARYSNLPFVSDDWSVVASGTYSANGSSIVLYTLDGRTWEFYYSSRDDTMMQAGHTDIYYRQLM